MQIPDIDSLYSVIAQIPIVGFLAWFVLKRDNEWRVYLKESNNRQTEAITKFSESIDNLTEQIAKNTATLLLHDATVKGVNPETMGTHKDILNKILDVKK